jgi:hypothetical protein
MAIHEQPTDQTTPPRPTPERIADACKDAESAIENALAGRGLDGYHVDAIRVLLAAAKSPTEEDVCRAAMRYAEEHMAMYREKFGGNLGALIIAITNAFIRGARSVSGDVEP